MSINITKKYRLSIIALIAMVAFSASAMSSSAASVTPTFVSGNPTCASIGYGSALTTGNINDPVASGSVGVAGGTISWTHDGKYLNWSSVGVKVLGVIVKGGPNANAYHYNPPAATSDTGLHSPAHPNPSQIPNISHIVFCYKAALVVTKTAETSFDRTYTWTVEKSVDDSHFDLEKGESAVANYQVIVDATSVDSNWAVQGVITIYNPAPVSAIVTGVTDMMEPDSIAGTVDCGVSLPYVLSAGETLECNYWASLPNADTRENTAVVISTGVEGGSATADVDFADAVITYIDEKVLVHDSLEGSLGVVNALNDVLPAVFNYTQNIGPYEVCDEYIVMNVATATSNDTNTEISDSASVSITVTGCFKFCALSQGYWFAKPGVVWPGTISIGGHTYTQANGKAIWNSSNKGGMTDAKKAFLQFAAIQLSADKQGQPVPAELAGYVAAINSFLTGKPKVTGNNITAKSAVVSSAAGAIGSWINENHCE